MEAPICHDKFVMTVANNVKKIITDNLFVWDENAFLWKKQNKTAAYIFSDNNDVHKEGFKIKIRIL